MDFLSLSSEYESYKNHFSKASLTMSCLKNFFTSIHQSLDTFTESVTNTLNELINSFLAFDHRSTHVKKFYDFSRFFEFYLVKLSLLSKKIKAELISPTISFDKFLSDENSYNLMLLQNLINSTINQKKKYEKIKHKYFESCQTAEKQEKKLLEVMGKKGISQNSITNQNELLTKLRVNSENECQVYKNELKITNEMYEENNKKYFPLINTIKDNEEKRINFLSFHLEKLIAILNEEKISIEALLNNIKEKEENMAIKNNKKNSLTVKLNEDIQLYQEKFNFVYKPGIRFPNEEIALYDIYRRNIESIINNNKKFNYNNLGLLTMDESNTDNSTLFEYNQRFFEFDKSSERMALDQNESIIYKNIFDNKPINFNPKLFSLFESKLKTDSKFATTILDKMLREHFIPKLNYQFKIEDNFNCLVQILNAIALNKDVADYSNKSFEMNFAIIYISEKVFLEEEKNKRKYICSVLAEKCRIFSEKNFWENLFEFKMNSTIKNLTDKELKEENKLKEKEKEKEKEKFKPIDKVKGAVKFLKDIHASVIAKNNSKKVDTIKKKKEKEVRYKILISLLKEFVGHFPNFNLDMPICNDIVMDISTKYNLEKSEVIFLINFINSNMYSIRNSNNIKKKIKSKYLINKINDINNIKQRHLLLIINSCFMFLSPKDYINLISVNKFYHKISEKTIFKYIFLKNLNSKFVLSTNISDTDTNIHINMWLFYLKYDKKTINYQEKIKFIKEKNPVLNFIETINLDVIRTFFVNNQEENRIKLKNILMVLTLCYPKVGYCQGMSCIVQFLLDITKGNEENSFHIFSAIISKTQYGKLFCDNFEFMKKYFYVFERLINIYLPELDIVLRKHNVSPSFYITPWFITLFTHNYSSNHTKVLIRIFDTFVLDGFISIIRIGLLLLKYYQNYIFDMKFEEILQFLINEMNKKYDFFNNSNYNKFIELYHEMKIPKGLLSNIENEYELYKKVEQIKQNYIEANSGDNSSKDEENNDENDF